MKPPPAPETESRPEGPPERPCAAHSAAHSAFTRALLYGFALLCLVLGLVGVVVPGMPTTVFILLAAWAAARSSPRLHGWLLRHRLFGPLLHNWANGRTVSRRAKWSATVTMAVCAVIVSFTAHRAWLAVLAIACMATVLAWLWSRPVPASA